MTVAERASELASLAQRQADRILSPSTRREAWDRTLDFAAHRPAAFTFLVILMTVILPPIAVFTTFVASVSLLSLGAAIFFTFFWAGVGLLVLLPTLFVASGMAIFLWAWTVTSFVIARSIARLFGWKLNSNGQLSQREKKNNGPFGGVDDQVSGTVEFDGKHLAISGNVDGKAAGAACKKEPDEYGDNYAPVNNQRHDSGGGPPVWAPRTDTAVVHRAQPPAES